jgi:hypothetical protein
MCKEIQKGSSAKSYIRKGLPNVVPNICEEMRQYLILYDEKCSHIPMIYEREGRLGRGK